jgi:hypothetical protein
MKTAKRVTGVKWSVLYRNQPCIAAYRGPDRCRLFRAFDMTEIKLTPEQKAEVDALVDAGAPIVSMTVIR